MPACAEWPAVIQRWRDAMLMIRFITAGAVLMMAVGAAAAQGAAGDTAGKPVSLLQVLSQPAKTTTAKPHARLAARRAAKHWARKSHEHATDEADTEQPAQDAANTTANATAANVWTTGDAAPLAGIATDATAPTVVPAIDQNLSELVVGGHTVQISAPDQFNAIDLAADHQTTPLAAADAQSTSAPAVALAEPDDQNRNTWYEELLATLGGALAAGMVAWLLIFGVGAGPQRMYG
jgi:hypothetical protein